MKKLHKLIIDRDKWVNGSCKNKGASMLRNDHGNMCCLGFLARSCGVPARRLTGRYDPKSILNVVNDWDSPPRTSEKTIKRTQKDVEGTPYEKLINKKGENSRICLSLMSLNDRMRISSSKREILLKEKLLTIGVDVKFVGGK